MKNPSSPSILRIIARRFSIVLGITSNRLPDYIDYILRYTSVCTYNEQIKFSTGEPFRISGQSELTKPSIM